jgi:hypothetical protein
MSSISNVSTGSTNQNAASTSATRKTTSTADGLGASQLHDPFLDSVNLTISPESLARIKAELEVIDANKDKADTPEQAAAKAKFFADRQAALANEPTIDSSSALFTDPYTSDRALYVSALIGFVPRQDSATVAAAVHDAIASPVHQWTDTTQAVDLATQKMKLEAIVNKMIPADKRARASVVVNKYIASQVEQRDASTLQGLEHVLSLRISLGDTAAAKNAKASIAQLKAGTYRTQQDMSQALAATSSLDFTSSTSLRQTASAALGQLYNLVQASSVNNDPYWTNQFSDYAQDWQSFAERYLDT